MRNIKTIIKLKKSLIALYVIGAAACGFYPVNNQPVNITIDTSIGRKTVTLSAGEVEEINPLENNSDNDTEDELLTGQFTVEMEGIGDAEIKEIRISRRLKSICVDKINSGMFPTHVVVEKNRIIFNANACQMIKKNSQSFMMERILLAEMLLAVLLLVRIFLNSLAEKLEEGGIGNHGPIYETKKFIGEVISYWEYMNFTAKADLRAEVANSYLNRLWWLLEPFFNMLVYVIVFGRILGNSVEHYSTFLYSSLLMWNYFSKTLNYSVKSIRNNKNIVTKIYVPKHVLLITNMILDYYKLLFSLTVLVPMLIIFRVKIGFGIFWVLPAYLVMSILAFGVGMIFMHYGVYVDDLGYAVNILLQMLMFLSGIFYDIVTGLHTPLNNMMLCMNPVSMFIDTMRNALLYNRVANVPLIILWAILSLLISYIGLHIVFRNENAYVKVV
ncbi:MAG: ABC transporter permease [Lachnospiraceae bacterium]|nr:ABC transporter permease [Lachnospiraceae bacterium]